jgi:hypothetical protein
LEEPYLVLLWHIIGKKIVLTHIVGIKLIEY